MDREQAVTLLRDHNLIADLETRGVIMGGAGMTTGGDIQVYRDPYSIKYAEDRGWTVWFYGPGVYRTIVQVSNLEKAVALVLEVYQPTALVDTTLTTVEALGLLQADGLMGISGEDVIFGGTAPPVEGQLGLQRYERMFVIYRYMTMWFASIAQPVEIARVIGYSHDLKAATEIILAHYRQKRE